MVAAAWFGVTLVHEYGHVIAGVLVGVPRREMRVSLRRMPHVALRTEQGWVRPGGREYVAVFRRHVRSMRGAFLYVAGGLVTETLAVVAFAVVMRGLGEPGPANVAARVSLAIIVLYLLVEAVLLRVRGYPFGDFSALWRMSRSWTTVLTAATLALHVFALWLTA